MISSPDNPDYNESPEEFLRYLLRRTGGQVTAEVVTAARDRFGIPRSTLFRLAARFRKTQRASSLRPRKRGTREGAFRLDPRTERVIAEQVDGFWLKKEKPSLAALLRRIREVCLAEGLSPPHRKTVQRRISELIPMSAARKRGEREIEAASHRATCSDNCNRCLHENGRGFPSIIGGTIKHVCWPLPPACDKTAWLDERGIDTPWPVAGLPEVLHCDNGADFSSRALAEACKEYGMKLQFRPPATPRFGGHIERLIGTMMGAVHLLPGTTFSNVKIRGGYDSEGRANLTLRELEKWIALEITGKYHQRIHSSLLRPPLAVWHERQGEVDFNLPSDRMAFWTSFLPGDRRRLLKDGIHLEKIRYWSDALSRDVGRGTELEIKYDPRDLSRIFVRQSDGRFIEARYRNLAFPPVSWWEWKHAKKTLRDQGRLELQEEVIFAAVAQQRQIEDIAASSSAKARRNIKRRPTERQHDEHRPITAIDMAKPIHSDDDTEFWDQ